MTDHPAWLHKKAPPLRNSYPAWSSAPMDHDVAAAVDEKQPRSYAGLIVIAFLIAGGVAIWVAWPLK